MSNSETPRLILASSSPYRRQMLERLDLDFRVVPADVDETPLAGEAPAALARRLARLKASAVLASHPGALAGALVIGADQVAEIEGRPDILGKPGDRQTAIEQLHAVSGREVVYHSGLALMDATSERVDAVTTRARYRELDDDEIRRYLDADTPWDCAGALRSEALGISLLESLESDDPTALIGLPLIRLSDWLRDAGFVVP